MSEVTPNPDPVKIAHEKLVRDLAEGYKTDTEKWKELAQLHAEAKELYKQSHWMSIPSNAVEAAAKARIDAIDVRTKVLAGEISNSLRASNPVLSQSLRGIAGPLSHLEKDGMRLPAVGSSYIEDVVQRFEELKKLSN